MTKSCDFFLLILLRNITYHYVMVLRKLHSPSPVSLKLFIFGFLTFCRFTHLRSIQAIKPQLPLCDTVCHFYVTCFSKIKIYIVRQFLIQTLEIWTGCSSLVNPPRGQLIFMLRNMAKLSGKEYSQMPSTNISRNIKS